MAQHMRNDNWSLRVEILWEKALLSEYPEFGLLNYNFAFVAGAFRERLCPLVTLAPPRSHRSCWIS